MLDEQDMVCFGSRSVDGWSEERGWHGGTERRDISRDRAEARVLSLSR